MKNWIKEFHRSFNKLFFNLGKQVGTYPLCFIIIPIFISILLLNGLRYQEFKDDPEYLFSPTNGRVLEERNLFEKYFGGNFSSPFHPSRIMSSEKFLRVIFTAKDNRTLLRRRIWKEIKLVDHLIRNTNFSLEGDGMTYFNVCALWNDRCWSNNIFDLGDLMPQIEAKSFSLSYPVMLDPNTFKVYLFQFYFGGVKLTSKGTIASAKALAVTYWLSSSSQDEQETSSLWEKEVTNLLGKTKFKKIEVARMASRTLKDDLQNNSDSVRPYLIVSCFLLFTFATLSNMMLDCVRSKPYLGIASIVSTILACSAAFGLLSYLKIPFIGLNMAAPFLMLGIGNDDAFIFLAAWRKTGIQDSVNKRMAHTYADAVVSITITSLTDMISFYIGILIPFRSVQIFCTYAGTAVFFTYLWQITFFGGFLAVCGYAEKNNRHGMVCCTVLSKSQAKNKGCCYLHCCAGGVDEIDPSNELDNKDHFLMIFLRDNLGNFLDCSITKGIIIALFAVYLLGAFYGYTQLQEGLDRLKLSREDFYSMDYYKKLDIYFNVYRYRVQVMITEDVLYNKKETQDNLLKLHDSFENLTGIADSAYTESWMRGWIKLVQRNKKFSNLTDEESFIKALRRYAMVRPVTTQAICMAAIIMIIVSTIFIPHPLCSLLVAFSIISIEIGVIGYMSLWAVNLDSISMINLIMCIGFSVDFSAHISYSYLTSNAKSPKERVSLSLYSLGMPILQGGTSTVLSVVPLVFDGSYLFVTFFKTVFLVTIFGILHSIFLLPVLLTLFGPGSKACNSGKTGFRNKLSGYKERQSEDIEVNEPLSTVSDDHTPNGKPNGLVIVERL